MFKIEFSNKSKKFLKKIDKEILIRIFDRIKKLKDNPFSDDCKRIFSNKGKLFRIRVGDYRILYDVGYKKGIIIISDIDKRGKIYK